MVTRLLSRMAGDRVSESARRREKGPPPLRWTLSKGFAWPCSFILRSLEAQGIGEGLHRHDSTLSPRKFHGRRISPDQRPFLNTPSAPLMAASGGDSSDHLQPRQMLNVLSQRDRSRRSAQSSWSAEASATAPRNPRSSNESATAFTFSGPTTDASTGTVTACVCRPLHVTARTRRPDSYDDD